jgi:hypothetical protein
MPMSERLPQFYNALVLHFVVENLINTVVSALSQDKRGDAIAFGLEEVPASLDILATLSEHYQISPIVPPYLIRRWRDTYQQLAYEYAKYEEDELSEVPNAVEGRATRENRERREAVEATFDRLESLSKQYPNREWIDENGKMGTAEF